MNDFTLTPLNVTINQVSLGTKKLTKTIFNQIEFGDCFNGEMDFAGDRIIGYIKEKDGRYLLWTINGKLRKTALTRYSELKEDLERTSLDKIGWFLHKTKLERTSRDEDDDRASQQLEEPERYVLLIKKLKIFLDSLTDKQIFI